MENSEKTVQGMHRGCPSCGGLLRYDIARSDLQCQSCGEHYAPESYLQGEESNYMDVVEYRCPQCGAAVHTTQTNMVSYCNFCGAEVLFQERMTRTRRPDKIVPFTVDRQECERRYREFMGKELPEGQKLNFQPVYVPFYYYREACEGEGSIDYKTKETKDTLMVISTFSVPAQTRVQAQGELECASGQFETETANKLQFGTFGVRDFVPGYLCGMYAEAPDLDADLETGDLSLYMSRALHVAASQKMEDGQYISSTALPEKVKDEAELWLQPVWLLAQSRGGRVLYTAVNGVSGHVVCDKPVKQSRINWTALLFTVLIFLALMLTSQLIILRGNVIAGLCTLIAAAGFYCINSVQDMHADRETQWTTARKSKRCNVVTMDNAETTTTTDARLLLTLPSWPLLGIGAAALVFGLALLVSIGLNFPPLLLAGVAGGIGCIAFSFSAVYSMWDDYQGVKENYQHRGTVVEWLLFHAMPIALLGAGIFVITIFTGNMNTAVAGLVSDGAWLPPFLGAASVVSLVLSRCRLNQHLLDSLMYILQVILNAVVSVMLLSRSLHNTVFLIAAGVTLIPVIVSACRMIARHNEFVTRPVPYFDQKGELK